MKTKVLYTVIVYPNKDSRQVIACHPRHGTNHYRNIVIAAMQDLTTIDEDRISITRDKFTVHLVFGELWYACLTPIEGSPVAASEVSLEVQEFLGHVRSVYRELPILADLSRELPNSSAGDLSRPLGKILKLLIPLGEVRSGDNHQPDSEGSPGVAGHQDDSPGFHAEAHRQGRKAR
uniref:Ergic3_1 protein n=1 Tax=Fopius arisanus TaxID=64838 RepID=A0A0C9R9L1_9HYME